MGNYFKGEERGCASVPGCGESAECWMRDWGEISVGIEARLRFVVLRGLRGVAVAAQPRERLGHLRLALRGIVGAFAEAEVKVVAAQLQGILQPRIRVGG